MKIHFTAKCIARLTEYWCIDPPLDWDQMTKVERLDWLRDNLDSAEYRSQQVDREEDRTIVDFYGSDRID